MPSKDALEPMVCSSKYSGYSRRSYLPFEALDSGDPSGEDHRLPRQDPPDLRSIVSPPRRSWATAYFSAGPCNCWGQVAAMPSVTTTGFDAICICAEFKPSRLAVTVIVPAVRVERTATRLMPHSVLRYVLLVESSLPLL